MPEPGIPSPDRARIEKYLHLDSEQLYSLIGSYKEGVIFDPAGQREAGREMFAELEGPIQAKLCGEWDLCARLESENVKDATNVVVIVGDVIASHVTGLPPFLIASLLVKIGLRRFCKC